jgi:outer membrane protein insertion porin family
MPVVPGVLALDGFADAAIITKEVYQLGSIGWGDWYFSVGPGVRFTIPQFPLRLLFAHTFRIEDGSVKWNDHWKFVPSFNLINK